MKKLTEHFYRDEATYSEIASELNIENKPTPEDWIRIQHAAENMEEVRSILESNVITVTSWYRNPEINRLVGGSGTSNHMIGNAIDFKCRGFGTSAECAYRIVEQDYSYNQLILYETRLHIDFTQPYKNQLLISLPRSYKGIDIEDVEELITSGYGE